MNNENINGYAVTIVDETFAVAHYGSQVVQTGTPDEVRAYCAPEARPAEKELTQEQIMENNDLQPWERELLASDEVTPVRDVALDENLAAGNSHFYGFEDEGCDDVQPAPLTLEYRVWCENGDLIDVFDNAANAEDRATAERAACPCGTAGADGKCGVIHPHGISVQAVEGDEDGTQDYLINGGA